jgi:pSer/pThr/pTyr-binding forkhead associated (FHA) protein
MSSLRLEVASGVNAGRVFDAELDLVRIGRALDNELELDDPLVSSGHARIVSSVDGFALQDSSSTNGTWLYRASQQFALGEALPAILLVSGDRITLGGVLGEGWSAQPPAARFVGRSDNVACSVPPPVARPKGRAAGVTLVQTRSSFWRPRLARSTYGKCP